MPVDDSHRVSLLNTFVYSLILTSGYVGVLYLRKKTRPSNENLRDDRSVMIERMKSICVYTIIVVFLFVPFVLVFENAYDTYYQASATLRILWGWSVQSPDFIGEAELYFGIVLDCFKALGLVSILFIGPLIDLFYFEKLETALTLNQTQSFWAHLPKMIYDDIKTQVATVSGLRNFIIGPITEEFVFRSGILALHLATGVSQSYMIFATPLYFGVAHLHHAYEMVLEGNYQPQVIFFICGFQLLYTTIYGWFAGFLFLRMGSIWPPIVVHMFCNFMGTPSFGEIGTNKTHTWIYRFLLVVGIVGFYYFLFPLTKSENSII